MIEQYRVGIAHQNPTWSFMQPMNNDHTSPENEGPAPMPLDYAGPKKSKTGLRRIILCLSLAVMGFVAIASLFPSIGLPREKAARVKCASNLRQIGQAILIYTKDFGGEYPDTFAVLHDKEDIGSLAFICPDSNIIPAAESTTQATTSSSNSRLNSSYIYLGKGFDINAVPADAVIAYEPMEDHVSGINVLFGDGHVDFVDINAAKSIMAQDKSGVRPVRWPVAATSQP